MAFRPTLAWIDTFSLVALPLVAALLSLLLKPGYLLSVILFYGSPAVYLALRFGRRARILKGLLFAVIVAVPFTIVVDYIGTTSGVWHVPASVFPYRLLSVIPIEDFLWMVLATYTVVLMHELLSGTDDHGLVNRRMEHFILAASLGLNAFLILVASTDGALFAWHSRYVYLALGSGFFLVPAVLFFWRFPEVLYRCMFTVAYFFFVTLIFEVTATSLKEWVFGGSYLLPPFTIFGVGSVPYEELFFVGIIGPLAAIAFFEFFDDNLV